MVYLLSNLSQVIVQIFSLVKCLSVLVVLVHINHRQTLQLSHLLKSTATSLTGKCSSEFNPQRLYSLFALKNISLQQRDLVLLLLGLLVKCISFKDIPFVSVISYLEFFLQIS